MMGATGMIFRLKQVVRSCENPVLLRFRKDCDFWCGGGMERLDSGVFMCFLFFNFFRMCFFVLICAFPCFAGPFRESPECVTCVSGVAGLYFWESCSCSEAESERRA